MSRSILSNTGQQHSPSYNNFSVHFYNKPLLLFSLQNPISCLANAFQATFLLLKACFEVFENSSGQIHEPSSVFIPSLYHGEQGGSRWSPYTSSLLCWWKNADTYWAPSLKYDWLHQACAELDRKPSWPQVVPQAVWSAFWSMPVILGPSILWGITTATVLK